MDEFIQESLSYDHILVYTQKLLANGDIQSFQDLWNETNIFINKMMSFVYKNFQYYENNEASLSSEYKPQSSSSNLKISYPLSYAFSKNKTPIFFQPLFSILEEDKLMPSFILEDDEEEKLIDIKEEPLENKNEKNIINDDKPICSETKIDDQLVIHESGDVLENLNRESDKKKTQKYPKKQSKRNILRSYKEDYPISQEEYAKLRQNGAPFMCPKCNKTCKNVTNLDRHWLRNCKGIPMIWPKWEKVKDTDGKKTKFFCQLAECIEKKPSQWFSDYKQFWKHHYEVHAPQAQSMYKCLQCPKSYSFQSDLTFHVRLDHGPASPELSRKFQCNFCGSTFKRKGALKSHEITQHTNSKPNKCPHCQFTASMKSVINRHIKSVHIHNSQNICETCGKSFNTQDKLKRHITTHTDLGEKCHFCGKMCKNLKRHIYVVHKQAVSCPDCPRVFQAQLGMQQHRKRDHGFGIVKTE